MTYPIERKKDIARWMGWVIETKSGTEIYRKPNGENGLLKYINFHPELGGQDLTDVLKKMTPDQRGKMYSYLPEMSGDGWDIIDNWILYFQDSKNAPAILDAIWKVITEGK